MSWETLIRGEIEFKEEISEEWEEKVQKVLELEDEDYEIRGNRMIIQSVNWNSHVDEDTLVNVIHELKDEIKEAMLDLYFLDDKKYVLLENGEISNGAMP